MGTKEVLKERLVTPSCHSEPFAFCHSEGAKRPKNLAQDKLREESRPFAIAQGDRINNLTGPKFDNQQE
jgi:hypothetical protein